jgi:lipid-binding SYLF domain-containing protein
MRILNYTTKILLVLFTLSSITQAGDTANEINSDVKNALSEFYNEIPSGKSYLAKAKAYIVFPNITEAGFFFGGKYGEGALILDNTVNSYYSITSASMGIQIGMQSYSLVIAFTSDAALKKFINDDDWETDVDFNFAMVNWNNDEELDDVDFGSGMVGFVFDSTGMMGNVTMEGTQFERITPDLD